MKKLIALAVAAAAMPAMAAVSVSGSYNVEYVDSTDKSPVGTAFTTAGVAGAVTAANASTSKVQSYDVDVAVSASSEMDNGMTISASLEADDSDNDGSVTISGAFGSIAMGDVAGALDAVDGAAIGTARDDLSAGAGTDASVAYTLPTIAEGLTVKASWSAEDGGNDATADATSVAAKYSMSGVTFHVGSESQNAADITGYGVSYSANGLTIGYGYSETDNDTGADTEITAVAAGYTMGNLTLAVNTQEKESTTAGVTTTTSDITTMSVAYGMGGGVTAYASSTDNDVVQSTTTAAQSFEDVTRVGIKFSF